MSTHLHFDPVGGIAGDMTVAALLQTGLRVSEMSAQWKLSGLPHTGYDYDPKAHHQGLVGGSFEVEPEQDPPTRSWADIRALYDGSTLPPGAEELARAIFDRLARAEATVHGCAVDDVHFHEVGAIDSITDITLAALLLDEIGAESYSCGSIPVCTGTVETAHGHLPLPAPATTELLKGFEVHPIPGKLETVTPTGAAIVATLCDPEAQLPVMRVGDVGSGFGSSQLPDRPNMLRVLTGERTAGQTDAPGTRGGAVMIEASIDDLDPRVYKSISARLFAAGALDVTLNPVHMKKQRPGTILSVVARPADENVLSELILTDTTTLGVRSWPVSRRELERHTETATTPWGDVRIKVGTLDGVRVTTTPEYDDCEILADSAGIAVKDVIAAASAAARLGSDLG